MADEALTAGAVARRLGVAVTTLRTWHQRYGLGPSHHVPGHHRRYTGEDLERLQVMRRLTAQGVAPAEAAAWARRVPMPLDVSPPSDTFGGAAAQMQGGGSGRSPAPETAGDGGSGRSAAPGTATGSESGGSPHDAGDSQPGPGGHPRDAGDSQPGPGGHPRDAGDSQPGPGGHPRDPSGSRADAGDSALDDGDVVPLRGGRAGRGGSIDVVWPEFAGSLTVSTRDGGGHTIRTGRAGPVARGLARAAMRLDGPSLRDILEMAVAGRGVVGAWEEVIMPVLIGIGDRYEATRRFIEVEHLISRSVTEVLGTVARPPSGQVPRVLLAAADEEQHTLPLEALAAALAEAGVATRFFGARVPTPALIDAVARTGPAAVVLWSQLPETGNPEQWVKLLSSGYAPLLSAAAGPGWPADGLPEGVVRIGSLQEGVRLVAAAAAPELPDFPTGRAQQSQ